MTVYIQYLSIMMTLHTVHSLPDSANTHAQPFSLLSLHWIHVPSVSVPHIVLQA